MNIIVKNMKSNYLKKCAYISLQISITYWHVFFIISTYFQWDTKYHNLIFFLNFFVL